MKKINKILVIILALTMMLALTACGGNDKNSGGDSASKMTTVSGDKVTAELPSGWILVTGTDMIGSDTADFICHTEKFKYGDPYLQVEEIQNLKDAQTLLESGNPYGTYAGIKELTNGTWYLAENAAVSQIGEKVLLVKGYQCDFGSDDVQGILGSLQ